MADKSLIRPPTSRIGSITDAERTAVCSRSPVGSRYDKPLDRESAAEVLQARAEKAAKAAKEARQREAREKAEAKAKTAQRKSGSRRQFPTEAAVKSFLRSMSSMLGREIMRGTLGSICKR